MAHYAKIENKIVTQVIVADAEFVSQLPGTWLKTSYNTRRGKHINPETKEINTKPPLRKNFAGVGYTYDLQKDAFIPPKPFNSWELNEEECVWYAPIPRPEEGEYLWDEETLSWVERLPPGE